MRSPAKTNLQMSLLPIKKWVVIFLTFFVLVFFVLTHGCSQWVIWATRFAHFRHQFKAKRCLCILCHNESLHVLFCEKRWHISKVCHENFSAAMVGQDLKQKKEDRSKLRSEACCAKQLFGCDARQLCILHLRAAISLPRLKESPQMIWKWDQNTAKNPVQKWYIIAGDRFLWENAFRWENLVLSGAEKLTPTNQPNFTCVNEGRVQIQDFPHLQPQGLKAWNSLSAAWRSFCWVRWGRCPGYLGLCVRDYRLFWGGNQDSFVVFCDRLHLVVPFLVSTYFWFNHNKFCPF